jgi:8-hydroxy-5-deazaflavin:NADPH oxidoreductase
MKIGILGRGNAGSAINRGLVGHEVRMVGSDPQGIKETAQWSEILFFAVPPTAIDPMLKEIGDLLNGKIVVDATNNFETQGSSEELQKKIPSAKVVKAFNHIFAQNMDSGRVKGQQLTMFVAGDDKDAKKTVLALVQGIGFDPVDAGPLKNGRFLDAMAGLIVQMAYPQGMGTTMGYRLVR